MRAIEYGVNHFGDYSFHNALTNLYVFDDSIVVNESENPESSTESFYLECDYTPNGNDPGIFTLKQNGNEVPNYVYAYLQSSNITTAALMGTGLYEENGNTAPRQIYKIDGAPYINKNLTELEEIELPEFNRPKKRKKESIGILNNLLRDKQLSVILFISDDGALIETAYQKIDSLFDNEVVLFIERNTGENIFGSVIRVKTGSKVSSGSYFPTKQISEVTKIFKLEINQSNIAEIFKLHFAEKDNKVMYCIKRWIGLGPSRVTTFVLNLEIEAIVKITEGLSKTISELKLEDSNWKYYDENREPLKDPDLFLPGLSQLEALEKKLKNNSKGLNHKELIASALTLVDSIKKQITQSKKLIDRSSSLRKIFNLIDDVLDAFRDFLKNPAENLGKMAKQQFIMYNAFMVGFINGIVEAVKGIFDLIAMIGNAAIDLNNSKISPMGIIRIFAEMIENAYEAFLNLFTRKNLNAIIQFFKDVFDFYFNFPSLATNWLLEKGKNTTIDELGYYMGYIIGTIVEMVLEILATGGAKTFADAAVKLAESLKEAIKTLGEVVAKAGKITIEFCLSFFSYIRNKSADLGAFFADLWKWINDLFEKGKQLADSIKDVLIRQYKISKATLELLEDLGVTIIRNIDDNLRHSPVLVTPEGFRVLYENKTLFEGTGDDIKRFADKIEDINKKSGSKGCKKYVEKLRLLKTDIHAYIQNRKNLKQLDSQALLNLFKEAVTVKELDAVAYYEKMIKKYPKLKGELDFEGKFRQVNFAEFSIKKGNKGIFEKEIKELYHSGDEHFYDEFINPFDDELTSQQFQKGVVDIKGGSRRNDSEAKFIYNFLKEHLHTADEFIIETKNIYFTCTSCQREIVMLKNYAEKLGKKIEIIVHGDKNILGGDDLYKAFKNK